MGEKSVEGGSEEEEKLREKRKKSNRRGEKIETKNWEKKAGEMWRKWG